MSHWPTPCKRPTRKSDWLQRCDFHCRLLSWSGLMLSPPDLLGLFARFFLALPGFPCFVALFFFCAAGSAQRRCSSAQVARGTGWQWTVLVLHFRSSSLWLALPQRWEPSRGQNQTWRGMKPRWMSAKSASIASHISNVNPKDEIKGTEMNQSRKGKRGPPGCLPTWKLGPDLDHFLKGASGTSMAARGECFDMNLSFQNSAPPCASLPASLGSST